MLPPAVLKSEELFYKDYTWCLNPCLTVSEAVEHLTRELARLDLTLENWQRHEVMTNAYLLACGLLNSVDDYLHGPGYHVPRQLGFIPGIQLALKTVTKMLGWKRARRVHLAAAWRQRVSEALIPFLRHYLTSLSSDRSSLGETVLSLTKALQNPLPAELRNEYTHIPSAFRKLDLTPHDVLALGRQFITQHPNRATPILVAGLRTAGSYFAPLFRALLENEGYQTVTTVTFRPDRGLVPRERAVLEQCGQAGYHAALVDDPPVSGETFAHAADMLRQCGIPRDRLTVLFPVHPSRRNWRTNLESITLAQLPTLVLEPEQWHKARLLEPAAVESRLSEYFQNRGYTRVQVLSESVAAAKFNSDLEAGAEEERRTRCKRVYEVLLETSDGGSETRFVLVKSVGWGYLAYHAFFAAGRLSKFVPPLLGLRDGLLYSEWVPQQGPAQISDARPEQWIDTIASYVAARVRGLRMPVPANPRRNAHKYNHGFDLLDKALSKAYGSPILAKLMRSRVRRRLAKQLCPVPTFIDGKMRPAEWLTSAGSLLKTDYEHHGMGKNELNVVDPAYDLAEAIMRFSLSTTEEERLLERYRAETGDATVGDRLFLFKLLAGLWAMAESLRNLKNPRRALGQVAYHRDYIRAWDFLTAHSARHCGQFCRDLATPGWRSPLVVLDIDGVIDRRVFGYPTTTPAGIEALALLHTHGFPVALNTARSVAEVKEYCQAYGCVGAVAEYGSYLWNAVEQRGRVLVGGAALDQLQRARQALARIPGVFLNEGYEYSIQARTFEEGLSVPLPTPLIRRFLAEHNFDQLILHQTSIDSTLIAADVNKGTGLAALLAWVGVPAAETIAIGDSEPDLPMFRLAGRAFAPSHIGCARSARFLGCTIAPHPYQRGLLHIVRSLAHPDGGRCEKCKAANSLGKQKQDIFLDLLRISEQKRFGLLIRALFHPAALEVFAD